MRKRKNATANYATGQTVTSLLIVSSVWTFQLLLSEQYIMQQELCVLHLMAPDIQCNFTIG